MSIIFLKKLFYHFYFRLLQLFKVINLLPNVGASYVLIFLFILFIEVNMDDIIYLILFISPIFAFHLNRKDICFIKKIFNDKWRIILFIEYTSLFFFFCTININYKISSEVILFIIVILGITFMKTNVFIKSVIKLSFINSYLFEWKSIIRKNIYVFAIYYVLLLMSTFHPFTLLLFATFYLDYVFNIFKYNENKEMFIVYFSKKTLEEKIKHNIIFLNILLSPIYFLFMIRNINYTNYLLYYILFVNIYCCYIISRKYSLYIHSKKESNYNTAIYIKTLIMSFLIIPAYIEFKKNIKKSNGIIKKYVRD